MMTECAFLSEKYREKERLIKTRVSKRNVACETRVALDIKYSCTNRWTSLSLFLTFFHQYFQETAISMSKCIPEGIAKLLPGCLFNEKLRRAVRSERLSLKTGRILLLRPLRHARLWSPIHPNHSHVRSTVVAFHHRYL